MKSEEEGGILAFQLPLLAIEERRAEEAPAVPANAGGIEMENEDEETGGVSHHMPYRLK